ncbi:hypothetical protein [Streptomyces sp. WM6386]|uniref:hypothetical protein n=1 Tax=Streptomyces sp. WM6386 TaxID=1415558 RepID=UPI000AC3FA28|nr:hypothetical protein [Streptomyces sp. WM6386]
MTDQSAWSLYAAVTVGPAAWAVPGIASVETRTAPAVTRPRTMRLKNPPSGSL